MGELTRRVIAVEGVVQGVGFRPFVYREATARRLCGFVRNDAAGVTIDIEGDAGSLADFLAALRGSPPALASITRIDARTERPASYQRFEIAQSGGASRRRALVAPDVATCDACLRELFDPGDRRFRYPFINCTDCGPRFTIVDRLPYDRPHTTMAGFPLCPPCRAEYEDPAHRRFHAQPTACAVCGPRLRALVVADGRAGGGSAREAADGEAALEAAVARIRAGGIVAVKGLGGYHLACDATDEAAVRRLRERKGREAKPLSVMVTDLVAARRLCRLDPAETELLGSAARPIVLLRRRQDRAEELAGVAPVGGELGVMLPYSPLHHLLARALDRPLVLTSGNRSDEPIVFEDAEAVSALAPMADLILSHDRPIARRCDDGVARVVRGEPAWVRRSRGAAPRPIPLPRPVQGPVLGVGGERKNTFCLAKEGSAFMSQHVGDITSLAGYRALEGGADAFEALFDARARVIAHDAHPDYLSTRLAREREADERLPVQHHHAHVAACAAELGHTGPVLGVAFDGAGLGSDGAVWGGEFLLAEGAGFQRIAHLAYVPLPGGDAAARRPDRMAVAHLFAAYHGALDALPIPFLERFEEREIGLLRRMLERGAQSPPTSSMGRLFDAVAALAGVCHRSRFEGEAAMTLERAARGDGSGAYRFELAADTDTLRADPGPVIRGVVADVAAGRAPAQIAARFHRSVSELVVAVAERVRRETGVRAVALTGGVFQNRRLLERTASRLERRGFTALTHRRVPCNDGGLSYGQVAVAAAMMEA